MGSRPKSKVRLYGYARTEGLSSGYKRVRSANEYHTSRWTRESKSFRASHPICAQCKKEGVLSLSQVVDHIVPFPVCGDFWDQDNWQALCKRHNVEKGNKDKKIIQEWKQQRK